jgi:hypothetical protein
MAAEHYGTFTILDYSEEKSSFRFNFGAITAVSLPGFLTNFGALRTALGNIILGTVQKEAWIGDSTVLDNTPPASSNAQVELKFLVSYEGDTTKKKFRHEIPTPDTSKVLPGTDIVDLTDTDVAAYVTAFETIGRSPDDDTETVTVLDMRLVGRNN